MSAGDHGVDVLAVIDAARKGTVDPADLYIARLYVGELIDADLECDAAYARGDEVGFKAATERRAVVLRLVKGGDA